MARDTTWPARKLWIAFAVRARGRLHVDAGAKRALCERGTSLLGVGITRIEGSFAVGDAVEVVGPDGTVFAKGLVSMRSDQVAEVAGRHSGDAPDVPDEVVHRDELVLLP